MIRYKVKLHEHYFQSLYIETGTLNPHRLNELISSVFEATGALICAKLAVIMYKCKW